MAGVAGEQRAVKGKRLETDEGDCGPRRRD